MKQITKKNFLNYIETLFNDENIIPSLSADIIDELLIGNSYYYTTNNKEIIKVQEWFNQYFQENIPLNNSVTGFRKKYSYLHLFEPHRQNYNFLRLDIRSFFNSIRINDIRESFKEYFEDDFIHINKRQSLIDVFINLITYIVPENSENKKFSGKQILPMGFITSPVISNIIFRKLDIQIQKLCAKNSIQYTRYADDMLFSSILEKKYVHSDSFINEISVLVAQMDFKLNKKKTLKSKHTVSLNGYTIQYSEFDKPFLGIKGKESFIYEFRLSNKKVYIIKKMIHMIKQKKKPSFILKKLFNYQFDLSKFTHPVNNTIKDYYNDQLCNKLTGYRSYLLSFIKFNKQYKCTRVNTINKYSEIIDDIDEILETLQRKP